jgi:hypothetical protein
VLSISPLLAWFFTLVLLLLAGRATARLALATARSPITARERDRELGHAAMGFGMAALLAPGVPRPPLAVSVSFFSALAAFAAFDWGRQIWARSRGHAVDHCTSSAGSERGTHLLDPHHAIVGVAMVAMLLGPGMGAGTASGTSSMAGMSGMTATTGTGNAPGTTVLVLLAYVWIAALVLGVGMTRVLAAGERGAETAETGALLSSPATVYACELAMTVLTGLMLLS